MGICIDEKKKLKFVYLGAQWEKRRQNLRMKLEALSGKSGLFEDKERSREHNSIQSNVPFGAAIKTKDNVCNGKYGDTDPLAPADEVPQQSATRFRAVVSPAPSLENSHSSDSSALLEANNCEDTRELLGRATVEQDCKHEHDTGPRFDLTGAAAAGTTGAILKEDGNVHMDAQIPKKGALMVVFNGLARNPSVRVGVRLK